MKDRGGISIWDFYKSVVVLANPKTVLNARYAKKEIREKVIRGDQLIAYIREQYKSSKELEDSDDKMKSWAESFLKLHKEVEKDYTQKYQQFMVVDSGKTEEGNGRKTADGNTELCDKLKAYRLEKSREEKIKPYYIFNNNQLADLIAAMPASKQELQSVPGFGPVKAGKYGDDILNIMKGYAGQDPEAE